MRRHPFGRKQPVFLQTFRRRARSSHFWLDGRRRAIAIFSRFNRLGHYMRLVYSGTFGRLGRRIGFEHFALGGLFFAVLGLVGGVALGGARLPASFVLAGAALERPVFSLHLKETQALAEAFGQRDYRLDRVRREGVVPRVFLAALPSDLGEVAVVAERKRLFLQTILPLVLHVNETIKRQRDRAIALNAAAASGAQLAKRDAEWLRTLYGYYGVPDGDFEELLRRADVVPPSLALAQAAEESGWGTSRFAQEGNAIFGQWTRSRDRGIEPVAGPDGSPYAILRFRELAGSVRAYIRNLNTHQAYREFRNAREVLRLRETPLNGYTLAVTLGRYSERGKAYIEAIRTLIRSNKLRHFDRAKLAGDVYASL